MKLKDFDMFKAEEIDGGFEITIPVVINIDHTLLRLRITPGEETYRVENTGEYYMEGTFEFKTGNIFYDSNEDMEYYYNLFSENDDHNHYDIKCSGDAFYKDYPNNFNPNVAMSQFVKFFVYLNDYIIRNNIT